MLAHKASHEGRVAVEVIAGENVGAGYQAAPPVPRIAAPVECDHKAQAPKDAAANKWVRFRVPRVATSKGASAGG